MCRGSPKESVDNRIALVYGVGKCLLTRALPAWRLGSANIAVGTYRLLSRPISAAPVPFRRAPGGVNGRSTQSSSPVAASSGSPLDVIAARCARRHESKASRLTVGTYSPDGPQSTPKNSTSPGHMGLTSHHIHPRARRQLARSRGAQQHLSQVASRRVEWLEQHSLKSWRVISP